MNRPTTDTDAIILARAALQAARHDADFNSYDALRQLLIGTLEDTLADGCDDHNALRRLVMRVHDCFRKVDMVVTVTTSAMYGLLDTIDMQSDYIDWLQGGEDTEEIE